MPNVYLSPSTDENELFVTGNNEEYYMNKIVDAMIPYLRASGIEFDRNDPGDTVQQIINKSNSKYRDLHLMLDMNTGAGDLAGKLRGEKIAYYTGSPGGSAASKIIADNLKGIYPLPELVSIDSNRIDPENRDVDAVTVKTTLGYRDNVEDAAWVVDHIDAIAKNLAMSLAEYLKVPFIDAALSAESWGY